jgi:hypothetical protein
MIAGVAYCNMSLEVLRKTMKISVTVLSLRKETEPQNPPAHI